MTLRRHKSSRETERTLFMPSAASKATWATSQGSDLLVTGMRRWQHPSQAGGNQEQVPHHALLCLMEWLHEVSITSPAMVGPHHHTLCSCPFMSSLLWGRWITFGLASVMHKDPSSPGCFVWVYPGTLRPGGLGRGTSCFVSWAVWIYLVLPWPDFLKGCQTAFCQTNPWAAAVCSPYVPCSGGEQGPWKDWTGLVASCTECEDNQLCQCKHCSFPMALSTHCAAYFQLPWHSLLGTVSSSPEHLLI